MTTHRIDGIKYNLEILNEVELEGIHGHLLETHARVVGEIALVENTLFARRHPSLFHEELEPEVNSYGEIADPVTWQRFMDATRDVI